MSRSALPEWEFVRAGPGSPIALQVPVRCRRVTQEHPRERGRRDADRVLEVTVELALRQVDGVFTGPYDLASFAVVDRDGLGISPELIRLLPLGQYISAGAVFSDRVVHIDPASGVPTHHRDPEETLFGDDRIVAVWLRAFIANADTNKAVAALLHISKQAVAQRISRLRAAGQLPPTTRGARR